MPEAKETQSTDCSSELFSFRAAPRKAALNLPSKTLSTMNWKGLVHLFTKSIFAQLARAWLSAHHLICLAHMEQGGQGRQCPKITPPLAATPDTSSLWNHFPTEQGCCNLVFSLLLDPINHFQICCPFQGDVAAGWTSQRQLSCCNLSKTA